MIKRLILSAMAACMVASAHASVWFSSVPSLVQSGTAYYVEASAWGGSYNLTIYKNGGYFAGGSNSTVGGSTTDYSTGTVSYTAEFYDWYTMAYDYAYATVTITPANAAPTITWVAAPASSSVGQWFAMQARGNDADGNLTQVLVWREWTPFAFSGGGNGYEGYSDPNVYNQTSPGNVTFMAKAVDGAGAESAVIYHTVSIYNSPPAITWTNAPSSAYVNQWFNVQARGDDGDGNLSTVYVWRDDQPFAFNGGGNGYQGYSDNNAAQGTAAGTITFKARATDANGADSGFIYHNVTISRMSQAITFNQPATQTYGTPLTLSATTTSGLTVGYTIMSGPATVSGSTVTFTGAGSVVVRAIQAGNNAYEAAPNVDRTVTVNARPVTFALSQTAFGYDGTAKTVTVVPTPSGATFSAGGTLSATSPGSYTATATGTGNYMGSNAALNWTITKAVPGGTFPARTFVAPTTAGYTVVAADLNAVFTAVGSGAAPTGTVSYSVHSASGSGAAPTSGSVAVGTVFKPGSYTIRASYPGDGNYSAASKDAVWTVVDAADTDGDGIPNVIETQLGTNPNNGTYTSDGANTQGLKIHKPN